MYVDFAINENGDLIFIDSNTSYSPLHFKFNITKTNTQKISFAIKRSTKVKHHNNNCQKISFLLKNNSQDLSTKLYKDRDALIQLIELQLKDTLGELPLRKEDGSLLSTYKHRNINDETLDSLQTYLTNFLTTYLNNPIVKVTPKITYINGYRQQVIIDIYNNEDYLLSYTLES